MGVGARITSWIGLRACVAKCRSHVILTAMPCLQVRALGIELISWSCASVAVRVGQVMGQEGEC